MLVSAGKITTVTQLAEAPQFGAGGPEIKTDLRCHFSRPLLSQAVKWALALIRELRWPTRPC